MVHSHNHAGRNSEIPKSPLGIFCESVRNMLASANGNEKQAEVPRFSIDTLLACFPNVNKEKFLTDKPLKSMVATLVANSSSLRESIRTGTRITLGIMPCTESGLELTSQYLDDEENDLYPYFVLLYSNPEAKAETAGENRQDYALGLGNMFPMPVLRLFPPEILNQCYVDVVWPEESKEVELTEEELALFGDIEALSRLDFVDLQDLVHLVRQLVPRYQRLQEVVKGRLK